MKNPEVVGGSGFAAATLQDLGFEPALGATGEAKPKNARRKMDVAMQTHLLVDHMIVVLWRRASLVLGSLALVLQEQERRSVGGKRVGFSH